MGKGSEKGQGAKVGRQVYRDRGWGAGRRLAKVAQGKECKLIKGKQTGERLRKGRMGRSAGWGLDGGKLQKGNLHNCREV